MAVLIKRGLDWREREVHTDPDGRYILLVGYLGGTFITIVALYGPNTDSPTFFHDVWAKVKTYGCTTTLWGGDFNAIFNEDLDRKGTAQTHHPATSKVLNMILDYGDMVDIWRLRHPLVREGTCFSEHRHAWSRLDYWLMTKDMARWVLDVKHLSRTISDHSPCLLTLSLPNTSRQTFSWRLPPHALLDAAFLEEIRADIQDYFSFNTGSVTSEASLWEAFKVVIRGKCISRQSGVLKAIRTTLADIETQIKDLERRVYIEGDPAPHADIKTKLAEYEEEATRETRFLGQYAEARRYGEGDRPGHTLASMLRAPRSTSFIPELVNKEGDIIRGSPAILKTFSSFYANLYTSSLTGEHSELQNYLDTIALVWFDNRDREYMHQPFTVEDVKRVIGSLPANKAPGSDGLTTAFYKAYAEELAPHLLATFEEAYEQGVLPQSMREAIIITLLKPGKSEREIDSYRPLSLINIDVKILAKLIANRIQPMLPVIALPDQSGFIPGRATSHNLRTVFSVLHYLHPDVKAAAIFLDATKAFDSLEWSYLFTILERMGFGPLLLKWIKLLYSLPLARVRVNGIISDPFLISRGTRQGCPLSPLLFAIAMEPLAARVRQHHTDRGIGFSSRSLLISLYADDVTLYICNPEQNLDIVLREFIKFGGLSGITINWSKSVIFPLTDSTNTFTSEYPLKWERDQVKYLGIWISRNVQDLWTLNYGSAVGWLEEKVALWSKLPLSIAGRIALTKMIVLPKFLYLFVNLPIILTLPFFTKLKSLLTTLIWAGGQARVSWALLSLPTRQGGLGAPDMKLYALCAQAQFLFYWVHSAPFQPHLAVETDTMAPTPLNVAVYKAPNRTADTIDTSETLRWAWDGLRKRAKLPILYAPSIPLAQNPMLPNVRDEITVKLAQRMSLHTFADLYPNGTFRDPPRAEGGRVVSFGDTFFYHKLRAACRSLHLTFPSQPPQLNALEQLLRTPTSRRLITRLYTQMQADAPITTSKAREHWNAEMHPPITDDQWAYCCAQMRELSPNYKLRLIHFKFMHRYYRTPVGLHKMGLRPDDSCWRCGALEASFLHMTWSCPHLTGYWIDIFSPINQILGLADSPSPLLGVLGYVKNTETKGKRRLHALLLLFAKRQIAMLWGRKQKPSLNDWIRDVTYGQTQLALFWELMPPSSRPKDIWDPVIEWLRRRAQTENTEGNGVPE